MRRLLVFTLSLCFAFVVLAGSMLIVGRWQQVPERLAMLHLTDCAPPCWLGIIPGVTTLAQATARIRDVYSRWPFRIVFDRDGYFTIEMQTKPQERFSIRVMSYTMADSDTRFDLLLDFDTNWIEGSRSAVQNINPSNPNFTFSEIQSVIGSPRSIDLDWSGSAQYVAYYPCDRSILVGYEGAYDPATYVRLTDHISELRMFTSVQPDYRLSKYPPWQGFTRFEKYGVASTDDSLKERIR